MSRSEYASDTFLAAAGSSLHLLRRVPGGEHRYDGVVVPHAAPVAAARFNRNNKVVAAGCADGRIQLAYSAGGGVMSALPEGGAGPGGQPLGPITALAWSAGSKRLVAGSADGLITLFDMQRQTSPACLGTHAGGVVALDFQHDDSFLAVASRGGSLELYPNPLRPGSAAAPLPPPPDAGPPLCLALAASEPLVAAGGAHGGVAVWDVPSLTLADHHPGLHRGHAAAAVAFVPTRPACLYSGGGDGRVCLLDRRRGPGHASNLTLGCRVTALMVREDHAVLGVGTADGCVRLFDPRNPRQPLCSTRLPGGGPITALQWQHRYHSLAGGRQRAASDTAAVPAGRGGQAEQGLAAGQGASAPPPPPVSALASSPVKRAPEASAAAAAAPSGPATTPASSVSRALPSRPTGPAASAATLPSPLGAGTPGGALPPAESSGVTPPLAGRPSELAAPAPALDVSPLPGAALRAVAAAAQPAPAQRARQEQDSSGLEHRLHRLGISPLTAGPGAPAAPPPPPPLSPLEQPAAGVAPPRLAITPLAAPGLARLAAAGGLAGIRAAPPSLDVAPLPQPQAGPPTAALPLAISPLPTGMCLWGSATDTPTSPKQPPQQQQRSVLGERTNSGGGATASLSGGMLSPLPAPLPAAAAREAGAAPQQLASPSFGQEPPLPDAQPASRPAVDLAAGGNGGGGVQSKAAPQMLPLSPMGSGGVGSWHIGAVAGEAAVGGGAAATPPPSAALLPAPAHGKTLEAAPASDPWSFAAAERSFQQLSSGPGAAWATGDDVLAVQQAAAGAVPPAGLRDDILALHLDMLTQFQAQQAATGALVGRLMERNEELGGEVAALRRQLDALTSRRDAFLLL